MAEWVKAGGRYHPDKEENLKVERAGSWAGSLSDGLPLLRLLLVPKEKL